MAIALFREFIVLYHAVSQRRFVHECTSMKVQNPSRSPVWRITLPHSINSFCTGDDENMSSASKP
jgi:hypothetical protein